SPALLDQLSNIGAGCFSTLFQGVLPNWSSFYFRIHLLPLEGPSPLDLVVVIFYLANPSDATLVITGANGKTTRALRMVFTPP
ncbi:MAG: hypothetical protein C5B47_02760, partial [Verrucomicrobia bacterium]